MLLVVGCDGAARRRDSDTALASASASGTPDSTLDPRARDPLVLMRLAEDHRAPELLAMVEGQGAKHTAALLALAYADDAELVLARLSLLALDPKREDRVAVLTVLRDIAYRRPRDRERLAPESLAACIANLRALAANESESPERRALAETTVNAFDRNGLVPPLAAPSTTASASPLPSSSPTAPTSSARATGD
ncbi:MAG: hypothetical protein FJ096_19885 [Deltaproteobacteria bacterium]|nr:hypothetical protein [Deltaproteobacteria bacterium]